MFYLLYKFFNKNNWQVLCSQVKKLYNIFSHSIFYFQFECNWRSNVFLCNAPLVLCSSVCLIKSISKYCYRHVHKWNNQLLFFFFWCQPYGNKNCCFTPFYSFSWFKMCKKLNKKFSRLLNWWNVLLGSSTAVCSGFLFP